MKPEKNPTLAGILSAIMPGAGQLYVGDTKRAVLFFAAYWVSASLLFVGIGFVLLPIAYVWSIVDAYKTANRINSGGEYA